MHVSIFFRKISKFRVLTTTHNNESFICSVYFNGVATSPFVAFSVTEQNRTRSRSDDAFIVQLYLLPSPPGNPRETSTLSGPGLGNYFKLSCPRGQGEGNLKSKLSTRRPCEARHFSDRVENTSRGNAQNLFQTG